MMMMMVTRRMMMTGMMMTVSRNPVKGPQWVLEITVPLFSPRNGPSTGFYL